MATNCTVCAQVGTEHNKSAAQVGLWWVLDRVPSFVVETGSQDHLDQDLAILDETAGVSRSAIARRLTA